VRIRYGNAGWVRVDGIGLPGPLYVRFRFDDDGRPRVSEIYIDGEDHTLSTTALRQVRFDHLEAAVLEDSKHLQSRSQLPGVDLHRLAAHFAHSWGQATYDGHHCNSCGGPIRGRASDHRNSPKRAVQNWVAESFFAQLPDKSFPEFPSRINQVPIPRKSKLVDPIADEFPAIEPPAGRRMTKEFLEDVARAYAIAARKGVPPAPAIAEAAGVERRTVHKWIYTARKRGIMPPGTRGRVG
jgi:hypothetical protein